MHLYTGKERDAETNNDYFGARYYSSDTGRFLSPDWSAKYEPVPYAKLDDPQSLNLYAYVENNPMLRVDPDGHEGPVKLTAAEVKQLTAMAYSEDTTGSVEENEAVISTAINRAGSGDKSYLNGSGGELNITNVINAPNQYQGVGGSNYNKVMDGKVDPKNATKAVQNVQDNGVSTDGTFPWTLVDKDGKPVAPTAAQQKRMCGSCIPATPAQVGNTYLFKPASPKPKPAPKAKPKAKPAPNSDQFPQR